MDLEFNKREDFNKLKLAEITRIQSQIKKGGGEPPHKKIRFFPERETFYIFCHYERTCRHSNHICIMNGIATVVSLPRYDMFYVRSPSARNSL